MSDKETTEDVTEAEKVEEVTSEEDAEAQAWAEVIGHDTAQATAEDSVGDNQDADRDADEDEPAPEEGTSSDEGDDGEGQDADAQRPEDTTDQEQREKRYRGTISAQDRKIRELQRRIASFSADENKKRDEDDKIDTLTQLREDYPDIINPMLDQIEALQEGQRGLEEKIGTVSELHSAQIANESDKESAFLEDKFPGWRDHISENAEAFWSWVDDQPKAIRDLAEDSQDGIQDGKAVFEMITNFEAHRTGKDAPQHEGSDTEEEPKPKREALTSRRLAGAKTVPSRGTQSATANPQPDETDGDAIWRKLTAGD